MLHCTALLDGKDPIIPTGADHVKRPFRDRYRPNGLELRVVTLYLGTANARLIVRSPDDRVGKTIAENNRWWLFQPLDGLTVLVEPARQTGKYRGGRFVGRY